MIKPISLFFLKAIEGICARRQTGAKLTLTVSVCQESCWQDRTESKFRGSESTPIYYFRQKFTYDNALNVVYVGFYYGGKKMSDKLLTIIQDLQSDKNLNSRSEAGISLGVVLRTLDVLNWSTFDHREVCPEYSVENRRVDYALLIDNAPQVFVEVKKGGELLDKHQEQLLDYAFREGIKLAILTNGGTWWFYLPLIAGSWEQRKFTTVELDKQNKAEIAQKLVDFLGKENVGSGKAFQSAEVLHKQNQRQAKISGTLPKAWSQLVSEPDDLLVDFLAEKTKKLCGHKPYKNEVKQFLLTCRQQGTITSPTADPKPKPEPLKSAKGTKLKAFTFDGKPYQNPTKSWAAGLVKICEILSEIRSDQFKKVLDPNFLGFHRRYFSKKPAADFPKSSNPQEIEKTGIYVEKWIDSNRKKRLIERLADRFGCQVSLDYS